MIRTKCDLSRLIPSIREVARLTNQTSSEELLRQTRLLTEKLVVNYPPKTLSQGNRAVKRDIKRSITLLDHERIEDPSIKKAVRNRDYSTINSIIKNIPNLKRFTAVPFSPIYHEEARNARRIVQRKGWYVTVEKKEFNQYIKHKTAFVGLLKSSFLAAARRLGSVANKIGGKMVIPTWVERHIGHGSYIDQSNDKNVPTFTIISRFTGINRWQNIADFWIRRQSQLMIKELQYTLRKKGVK